MFGFYFVVLLVHITLAEYFAPIKKRVFCCGRGWSDSLAREIQIGQAIGRV